MPKTNTKYFTSIEEFINVFLLCTYTFKIGFGLLTLSFRPKRIKFAFYNDYGNPGRVLYRSYPAKSHL
jgi:hypothetical protein